MTCVSDSEMNIILEIIEKYSPDCDVLAFGSRYKWTPKDYSDLDLAFVRKNGEKLGLDRRGQLEDAFSESDLPYRVDVVDYNSISVEFRAVIDKGNEKIYQGREHSRKADWKIVKLGEAVVNFDKQRIPLSSRQRESRQGKYPYYGAQGVIDWIDSYIFDGKYLLVAEDGENLLSKKQPVAQLAEGKFWVNNHAHILQNNEYSDINFLCYLLNSIDISAYITGSAQPKLSQSNLHAIEINLPDLSTQRTIADMLCCFDAKIANNTKINHHLEQMAQAIFTKMCSVGENTVLSDILTVCYGKDHKHLGDGEVPCYGSGGVMRYVEKALYDNESVLIPRKGTLSNVIYINEPFWTVDTMFYTQMTHPNVAKFVYFTVRELDLAGMNVGSAVPSMTTAVLNALEIALPSNDNLARFEESVNPMFLQIQANNAESTRLANLRDTLLPRLISGELSVADLAAK